MRLILLLFLIVLPGISGCGVYSFTGATIEGKSINIHVIENRAQTIAPSLSPVLSGKIRNRILSQTGLAPINSETADYDLSGYIKNYNYTVAGLQNTQQASQNRLTIEVEITFKNKKNEKANFNQTFTRFADFPSTQSPQAVEGKLFEDIATQLADDIFNKAFVNW